MRNLLTVIGAVRSGSTWLHQSLCRHSSFQCAAGRVKEVCYFDTRHPSDFDLHGIGLLRRAARRQRTAEKNRGFSRRVEAIEGILKDLPVTHMVRRERLEKERDALQRFVTDFAKDDDWYRAQFSSDAPWAIDSSPNYYAMNAEGFSRMLSIADRVVCVMLLRDPAQMLTSRLRHSQTARRTLPAEQQAYLEFVAAEYVAGLKQTKRLVPGNLLRFVRFAEMISEPQRTVGALLTSIGVESDGISFAGGSPNPSAHFDIAPAVLKHISALASDIQQHLIRLGLSID